MLCYYLNVHFQGQRVKHIESEDKSIFVHAGLDLRIQEFEVPTISRQSPHGGDKVVPGTHFC